MRGLGAVAVWWCSVVDRGEVGLVVSAAPERRDDVVDGVSSRLLADVADARVASQDAGAEALPVVWEWCAPVARHVPIMLGRRPGR